MMSVGDPVVPPGNHGSRVEHLLWSFESRCLKLPSYHDQGMLRRKQIVRLLDYYCVYCCACSGPMAPL
jgi:hypothetical protein